MKARVRIRIAPGHIAQRFAVHEDIEVDRFALPLAERATRATDVEGLVRYHPVESSRWADDFF